MFDDEETQDVYDSRDDGRVIAVLRKNSFSQEFQQKMRNGEIWRVYYNSFEIMVGEDINGNIVSPIINRIM